MTEPEITVKKLSHYVPVSLTDVDEQGRQHYVRKSVEDAGGVRDIWREYWSRRARLRRMHHLYRQRRR